MKFTNEIYMFDETIFHVFLENDAFAIYGSFWTFSPFREQNMLIKENKR